MPEYPVRPQHPYGSDPAEESPTRAPYPRGRSVRGEDEYQRRPDNYGNAQDGDRGWDRPRRGDWSGPDERAAWKDTDRREDRSAYGLQNRLDRQAQEEIPEPPARPLSRRARREAERGLPEGEGEPTTWGNDETEPRWNGRTRLRSASDASDASDASGEEVPRPRYRSLGPLTAATTGMMNLIRGHRRVEPSDATNPHDLARDQAEELKTERRRSSFFDMESEAPEPGRTPGNQESGSRNGASFPSLGGSRTGPPPRAPQSFRQPKPRRRRAPLVAAVLAVLLVIGGVVYALGSHGSQGSGTAADTSATPSAAGSTPKASATKAAVTTGAAKKVKLGVFKGGSSPSQVGQFSSWLGREVDYAMDFSTRSTWDEIANPTYMLNSWQNSGYKMVYAVAMLPMAKSSKATLAAGAEGDYDHYFETLARNLVAYGQGDSIIRLGWEFNVSGWPWHPGPSDQEDFVGYWRHIVKAMRSVPGAEKLQFDWNVNNGGDSYDSTIYYPGKKYVDYIGVDVYDTSWGDEDAYPYPGSCNASCKLAHQQQAWDDVIGATFGLSFWSSFAKSEGRKLSLPEWGLWDRPDGHGGGDDPYFIQQMYKFIDDPANNVGYQAYFDYNTDSKGNHKLETLSKGGAKYQKLFGQ